MGVVLSMGRVLPAFAWYDFGRIQKSKRVMHAMEAGVSDHVWSVPGTDRVLVYWTV